MASCIGTEHYGFTFTVQEGLDAVSDVIYHLETYDITTIRAGTPMFLLSRKVIECLDRALHVIRNSALIFCSLLSPWLCL